MKANLAVIVAVVLSVGFESAARAGEPKRYVVLSGIPGQVKKEMQKEGGIVEHDMRYHSGFVAHFNENARNRLEKKFGSSIRIEEDVEVSANGKPRPAPSPTPAPAQNVPWGISAIRATQAHAYNRGAGITVCIVDSGIQPDHPDLAANIAGGENFVVKKGSVDPALWADDNSHGTHVAGTVAALDNGIGVVGVAPSAKLFAAKVLNNRGTGYVSAIADGIRSCVAHGARVINMSLGASADSSVMHDAIRFASQSGVILVAAAGNESSTVSYPAKYPEVIAVSAVDSTLKIASFSNTGPEIAFAAPGVSVRSTIPGSTYEVFSGTSMASPHVAGVVALMLSSGSLGLLGDDIGLSPARQGQGMINALATVLNQLAP